MVDANGQLALVCDRRSAATVLGVRAGRHGDAASLPAPGPGPAVNLASLIEGHPADGRALYEGGRWHTWGELRRRAAAAAAGLVGLGVGPGDRVAIAWPTSVDFVVAYLGVLAAGCVAVPLNPNSPAAELGRELEVVTPAALLAGGAAARLVTEMGEALGFAPLIVLPDLWAVLSADPLASRWRGASGARTPAASPAASESGFPVVARDDGDSRPALHLGHVRVGPRRPC